MDGDRRARVVAPSRMSPVRAFLDLLRAVRGSVTVALSRTSRRTRLTAALVGLVVAVIGVAAIAVLTGSDDDAGVAAPAGVDADVVPAPAARTWRATRPRPR